MGFRFNPHYRTHYRYGRCSPYKANAKESASGVCRRREECYRGSAEKGGYQEEYLPMSLSNSSSEEKIERSKTVRGLQAG